MKIANSTVGVSAQVNPRFMLLAGLATLALVLAPMAAMAAGVRVETINSPLAGLPDQDFQSVTFATPVTASLVTIANLGGTGNRSFLVTLLVSGGGAISVQGKEDQPDIIMPLTEPIPISGVSIRCDSFSVVNCKYIVTVVGK